jgi:hypothetical protein
MLHFHQVTVLLKLLPFYIVPVFAACATPVEMVNSDDTYFSKIIVDGKSYSKPPYPRSFDMTKPSMTVEFYSANEVNFKYILPLFYTIFIFLKATLTSVGLINSTASPITQLTVDTDYDTQVKTSPDELYIKYDPNLEYNFNVQFALETPTKNVKFPQIVQLAIHGCGTPTTSALKAQIEGDTIRSTAQPLTIDQSSTAESGTGSSLTSAGVSAGTTLPGATQVDQTQTGAALAATIVSGVTTPSVQTTVGELTGKRRNLFSMA